ncbi:MAG: hypothetical protein WBC97_02270 [Gemmatimonadales bacterium]
MAANPSSAPSRSRSRLLAGILAVLACLPILVFATNATQRGPLVTARDAVMKRAGVRQVPDSARRVRQASERRRIRPAFDSAALGMAVQLFWIVVIGVVGRKWFGLRL